MKQMHVIVAGLGIAAGSLTPGQAQETLLGADDVSSVTYGSYVRLELGQARSDYDGANWLPPGKADPRVAFAIKNQDTGFGAFAYGYDWMNGFRGELSVNAFGTADISGPSTTAAEEGEMPHGDITDGSLRSTAVLASLVYSPLQQQGTMSRLQPFVTAGIGFSRNDMGDWTRANPASSQPVRTFDGHVNTDLAWSVGAGFAYQVTQPGRHPIMLEAAVRYFDLGEARGGTTADDGKSRPREPLNFDVRQTVFTIGLRIPLQRL